MPLARADFLPLPLAVLFQRSQLADRATALHGINFAMRDNAFTQIADWHTAQELSDRLDVSNLHPRLDQLAARYCPVVAQLGVTYHWSLMQVEYATDIVFKRQSDLADLYQELIRTAIHAVKRGQLSGTQLARQL